MIHTILDMLGVGIIALLTPFALYGLTAKHRISELEQENQYLKDSLTGKPWKNSKTEMT